MSSNLQILPSLRRPAADKENVEINIGSRKRNRKLEEKRGIGESDESEIKPCETPKSDENRIPKTVACPPAPRKPMRRVGVMTCKRKLMPELEYFEADQRKEVDEFFRSSFERISSKRKFGTSRAAVGDVAAAASALGAESSCSSSSLPV